MAARKRAGLAENTRMRIKTSMLVNRLQDHIDGTIELTASQLRAIEILLKKTLPDLSSIEMTAEVTTHNAKELTESDLLNIATAGSEGDSSEASGEEAVH